MINESGKDESGKGINQADLDDAHCCFCCGIIWKYFSKNLDNLLFMRIL